MTDNTNRKVQRGPLVSSREVLTKEQIDESEFPHGLFAEATAKVTQDLIYRVGYQNKITVTIEPLKSEHPQSPGYMVAAKMRRP